MGRTCPFENPEGVNIGRILHLATGAQIRDGRLSIVDDRPEAALGVTASMVPFVEHDDPTRNRGDGIHIGWYIYVGTRPQNPENVHGHWKVWGYGPDKTRQGFPTRPYAMSNGLISKGDIIASDKTGFLTEDITSSSQDHDILGVRQ